jgi:hypothetical protein
LILGVLLLILPASSLAIGRVYARIPNNANSPNPFTATTRIHCWTAEAGWFKPVVCDVREREGPFW